MYEFHCCRLILTYRYETYFYEYVFYFRKFIVFVLFAAALSVRPFGVRYTLQLNTETDLKRDILKSETCAILVPELDLETDFGMFIQCSEYTNRTSVYTFSTKFCIFLVKYSNNLLEISH